MRRLRANAPSVIVDNRLRVVFVAPQRSAPLRESRGRDVPAAGGPGSSAVAADPLVLEPPPMGATPVPVDLQEYPEPVPRHVVEKEGTRFAGFVSTSEWNELQARRRKQRARGGARRHAGGPAVSRRAARLDDARGGALHGPRRARRVVTTRAATEGPARRGARRVGVPSFGVAGRAARAARALVSPAPLSPSRAGACSPRARSRRTGRSSRSAAASSCASRAYPRSGASFRESGPSGASTCCGTRCAPR